MTDSTNKIARLAGFLYLILVVTGILNLMYIPSQIIESGNSTATIENIRQSEMLFRWGIVCGIVSYLAFMGLSLVLYKLLNTVSKPYAQLMVIFVLVSIPLSYVNLLNKFSVLTLVGESGFVQELSSQELQYQVMFYLKAYNNGIQISQIFWGLWLFPFGNLVYWSGYLPKILGVLLMAGCFGYLIEFFGHFLFPSYKNTIIPTIVGLPASIGEIGICLWLLVFGNRKLNWKKNR